MIWLGVRLLGLLLTRAWGLIIAGIIVAGIGGGLFPSHTGAIVTPGYARGCIKEHAYSADGSSHELMLGIDQPTTIDNCPADKGQAGIGYQFMTSDLSPAFPLTLQASGIVLVEIWYQPGLSSGMCGPGNNQHSCQIATVLAVRTYTADGSGDLVAGTLYKANQFTIGAGDLTQRGYNPTSAFYTNGSLILPISLLAAGALVLGGGLVWLLLRRGTKSSKLVPQHTTIAAHMGAAGGGYPQSVYSQTPGSSQPSYPQQPGYSQPQYPQRPGSSQWPNQRP